MILKSHDQYSENIFEYHIAKGNDWNEQKGGNESYRVLRGGSWYVNPVVARAAYRFRFLPVDRHNYVGFRVVRRVART